MQANSSLLTTVLDVTVGGKDGGLHLHIRSVKRVHQLKPASGTGPVRIVVCYGGQHGGRQVKHVAPTWSDPVACPRRCWWGPPVLS